MKKLAVLLLVLLAVFGVYWFMIKEEKKGPADAKVLALAANNHSPAFDAGIDSMMDAYFAMKEAFVNAEAPAAKAATEKLILLADSSRLTELKQDTTGIYQSALMQLTDIKLNAQSLLIQTDITEMRQDFRMVGENIYPLLKTIHYEGKTLYWQNCPMAFGEDKGANWISNTAEVVNPYLGKNHPEFKGSMLHCGEVKDSIQAK